MKTERRSSCRDRDSGLFHGVHFQTDLERELVRLDRWGRPLSLALVELTPAPDWAAFGHLAQAALRPIDMAARLSDRRAVFLFPDADAARTRRWLNEFLAGLRRDDRLARLDVRAGLALARPRAGLSARELLTRAVRSMTEDARFAGAWEMDPGTAIVEGERLLLFEGFRALEDSGRP